MPESPECQTFVDGLKSLVLGQTLISVQPIGGRYSSKSIPGLTTSLCNEGVVIEDIQRHGKAIIFKLSSSKSIVVTLGMTGKFSLQKEKHAAVLFSFSEDKEFYFVDQRRFGTVRIIQDIDLPKILPRLGWDALSEEVDVDRVKADLLSLKEGTVIGSALLNNEVFSGIGNYLRAEILYDTAISPWRTCRSLSEKQIEKICRSSRRICLRSYELGGNTIENFVDLDGKPGSFVKELKVYGKRKDEFENEIIAEKSPEGRTIHWCPAVQE